MSIYVTKQSAPEVTNLAMQAFPSYGGTKFRIQVFSPKRLDSYWCGGSKSKYKFIPIAGGASMEVPENGGHPLQNGGQVCELERLPEGVALVEHSIFCGKDMGLTVYVNEANINSLALPAKTELNEDERFCLLTTKTKKSAYRKEEYRRKGWTDEQWAIAQNKLKARGLLNKAGAITPEGRNAV